MRHKLFIGNDWVEPAEGMYFPDVDPATEEPTVEIARGTAPDVDRAVRAAKAAMRGPWQKLTPAERGGLLFKLADLVGGAREELAAIETKDMGKPLSQARGDVDGVVATLRYNAGAADKMEGDTIPVGPEVIDFTLLEPLGVTAHIVPGTILSAWPYARSPRRSPPAARPS